MDVLGVVIDVLGVIIDVPRPFIYSLMQRNLTGRSLNVTIGQGARTW